MQQPQISMNGGLVGLFYDVMLLEPVPLLCDIKMRIRISLGLFVFAYAVDFLFAGRSELKRGKRK